MIHIADKQQCCGCAACELRCPKQCITMQTDSEGFLYPVVEKDVCIDCGLCEKVCHKLHPYDEHRPETVLAAINPDEQIREESSSGGVFTLLAERIISEGGVVFGARFDSEWQVVLDYTEHREGLAAFRGSKYVQARTALAYQDAERFLKAGRQVMFTGTPCQIAGLRHFLRRDYDRLLTVDFVCHGTPSPKVWSHYLDEVTANARRAVSDVQFRNKREGWKRFHFRMDYSKESGQLVLSSWHQENHYMRAFLRDLILRPSCHACRAKCGRSHSDLTIADFWGIGQLNPQMDDDRGTSLVLIHTEHGRQWLDTQRLQTWQTAYADALRFNPSLERSVRPHTKRKAFFNRLDAADSIISLIETTLRPSLMSRLKTAFKRMLKQMLRRNGGGKSVYSEDAPLQATTLPPRGITLSDISRITFRSKRSGWKQYRMEIRM